jgi:hypothetical protein
MLAKWFVAALLGLAVDADTAWAQRVESMPRSGVVIGMRAAYGLAPSIPGNNNAGAARLGGAVGGLLIGTVVGGYAGYQVLPHCGGCEDPGLDQMVYGAFIGGAAGAAIGAALPRLGSSCSREKRLQRTTLGAAAGGLLGFLLGGGLDLSENSLILVPAGSVAGALGALGRCWK